MKPKPEEHHQWPKSSAGRIMVSNVPTVGFHEKLSDIQTLLQKEIETFETINYIYVLDQRKKLKGVLSIKDLYQFPHDTAVHAVCVTEPLISVRPHTDQERAVYVALEHSIKAVPVVDKEGVFLGVIPSDIILSIMHLEMHEDVLSLAGITGGRSALDNILRIPLLTAIKHRLPWLLIGILGGIFAAYVIGSFKSVLEENVVLAAFIPLIVYIGGATAVQIQAFAIRDFVIIQDLPFHKYFLKQIATVLGIGSISAVLLFIASLFFRIQTEIAEVLSIALFFAVVSSIFTGLLVPYFFTKILRVDPANASGPIATIIQDIISVVVYFGVATLLL